MEKSIHSKEYLLFLEQLKAAREKRQITQVDLADRLGQTQSFISKVERGERRIDVVELRSFCAAIGVSFAEFVATLDKAISNGNGRNH